MILKKLRPSAGSGKCGWRPARPARSGGGWGAAARLTVSYETIPGKRQAQEAVWLLRPPDRGVGEVPPPGAAGSRG